MSASGVIVRCGGIELIRVRNCGDDLDRARVVRVENTDGVHQLLDRDCRVMDLTYLNQFFNEVGAPALASGRCRRRCRGEEGPRLADPRVRREADRQAVAPAAFADQIGPIFGPNRN